MSLQGFRAELDQIDGELTRLFAERMAISEKVAVWKRENGASVLDAAREQEKLRVIRNLLPEGLGGYGEALYARILALSRARQRLLLGENVILIGMPGCGKTTVARALGELLGCEALDCDETIERSAGQRIPEIFAQRGEEGFRLLESEALSRLCARRGCVIATGGGCVTREENRALLRRSGAVVWLRRELDSLPAEGRPLSLQRGARELYAERAPLYERLADITVANDAAVRDAALRIIDAL